MCMFTCRCALCIIINITIIIILSSIIIYTKINTTTHAIRGGVNLYREHTYHNIRVFFCLVVHVTRQMIIIGGASLNELVSCARRSSHRY